MKGDAPPPLFEVLRHGSLAHDGHYTIGHIATLIFVDVQAPVSGWAIHWASRPCTASGFAPLQECSFTL